MKNNRIKIIYWLVQIIGWLFYGILLFITIYKNTNNQFKLSVVLLLVLNSIIGITLSHFLRFLYRRKKYFHFNARQLIPRIIIYSGLVSITYTLISKLFSLLIFISFLKWDLLTFLLNTTSIFVVFILWSSIYITYLLFEESRKKEIYNLMITKTQTDLELQNLRSQLNPHFLFNSLNAIRALIEIDPSKAKNGINLLSNLLRSTLSLNSDKLVTINKEMELVEAYLELEKIRFEERLIYIKNIDENCLNIQIPAFTIQTLVENSIKHGISKLINGGSISINIQLDIQKCKISVINSGNLSNKVDLGIGLENLKKRLKLQYAEKFTFSIRELTNFVEAEIQIPTNNSF